MGSLREASAKTRPSPVALLSIFITLNHRSNKEMQASSHCPIPSSLSPLQERSVNVSFSFLKFKDFSKSLKHQHVGPASCKVSQRGFLFLFSV